MSTVCYTLNGILHVDKLQEDPAKLATILPAAIAKFQASDLETALEALGAAYPEHNYEYITALCLLRGYAEFNFRTGIFCKVVRIPSIFPSTTRIDPTLPADGSNLRPLTLEEWERRMTHLLRHEPEHYFFEDHPPAYAIGRYIVLQGDAAAGWVEQGDWLPLVEK